MLDECKLAAALVFAAIAGLTAMLSGLLSEVRLSVILLRTAGLFVATGLLVYIGAFILEKMGYGQLIKDTEQAMADLKKQEMSSSVDTADMEAATEAQAGQGIGDAPGKAEESQEDDGFAPMDTGSLRRVTGSAEG